MSSQSDVTLPSNSQIVQKLESTAQVIHHEKEWNDKLDQRGKDIATTAANLIQTSKELIQDKNHDEKFQTFINHAIAFGEKLKNEEQEQLSNQEIKEAREKLVSLTENFRSLIKQMVTSSEYRSMFLQMIETLDRIIFNVAKRTNDKSGQQTNGPQQTSQFPPSEQQTSQFPPSEQTSQFPPSQQTSEFLSTQQLTSQFPPTHSQEPAQNLTGTIQVPFPYPQGFDHTSIQGSNGQSMMNEVTEEEKRTIARDFLNLLAKMGKNPEYREATNNILGLFDYFRSQKEDLSPELKDEMRQLYREGVSVVQEFAGHKDLTQLETKFWELYKVWMEDQETKKYFHEFREWINRVLTHPECVDEQEVVDESSRLINHGYDLARGKYASHVREITEEFKQLLTQLQSDEYSKQFQEHLSAFQEAFRKSPFETLSQTRHFMFPVIRELLDDFHLPRVEGTTDTTCFSIDHMVLKGRKMNIEDLVVNMKFGMKDLMELTFTIKDISAGIKNADFTYHSGGRIVWNDMGTFDAFITAPKWKIKWVVRERKDQPMRLEVDKLDIKLDKFDIQLTEARHKFLDNLMLPLLQASLKKRAETELEAVLRKQAEEISDRFNSMFFQAKDSSSSSTSSSSASPTLTDPSTKILFSAPTEQKTSTTLTIKPPVSSEEVHPTH